MERCEICNGSKFIIGLGHIKQKCKVCNGKGSIEKIKLDKDSNFYKESVKKIKKKYKDLSIEKIEEMIEEEFNQLA